MGIIFALIAGLLASIANFAMRKSIDAGGSSRGYLIVQVTFSFLIMILLNPVRTDNYIWDNQVVTIGLVGGLLFGALMWCMGKTVENGPPGLSFAVLNSASVAPAIIMSLLFGSTFGHSYSLPNAVGSLLVVLALFWAGARANVQGSSHRRAWLIFVSLLFLLHLLFLVFLQWWAMLLKPTLPYSSLLPFVIPPGRTAWFMPAVLFVGALFQLLVYLLKSQRRPKGAEIYYGLLGGLMQGGCTFFLILAPQVATAWQNAMLFPIFAVSIIIICNIWAQLLYKERVNWSANTLALVGILIGTVDWPALVHSV